MKAIIDTNVLMVSDHRHGGVNPECISECIDRLRELRNGGKVIIDDNYHILQEYLDNLDTRQGQNKEGTIFLIWLLNNQANPDRVEQIRISEIDENNFDEFPDPELEPKFDPPDRKFVAVANAHPERPPIWQAADCKWLDWWLELQAYGISVDFLCPDDVTHFYVDKFPDREPPVLP